jgi:hypothetical protein
MSFATLAGECMRSGLWEKTARPRWSTKMQEIASKLNVCREARCATVRERVDPASNLLELLIPFSEDENYVPGAGTPDRGFNSATSIQFQVRPPTFIHRNSAADRPDNGHRIFQTRIVSR